MPGRSASAAGPAASTPRTTPSPPASAWCISISCWWTISPCSRTSCWASRARSLLREATAKARAALADLSRSYGLDIDPDAVIHDLPVGLQQRVEILKALYRGAEILILDEPTAVLTPQEVDQLFVMLRRFRELGKTVILITHKLREIMAVTDRVTVMRGGAVVDTVDTSATSREQLAEMMVGRKVLLQVEKPPSTRGRGGARGGRSQRRRRQRRRAREGRQLQRARGRDRRRRRRQRQRPERAAGGARGHAKLHRRGAGQRQGRDGGSRRSRWPRRCVASTSPMCRRTVSAKGLVGPFAANESAILGYHDDPDCNGLVLMDRRKIVARCQQEMRSFDVRPCNPVLRTAAFSGGNQQKIVLAREIERDPALLLVGQPTRGVDIGAIEFIHRRLLEMRAAGKAILLVSVELDEILLARRPHPRDVRRPHRRRTAARRRHRSQARPADGRRRRAGVEWPFVSLSFVVIAGLDPAIHASRRRSVLRQHGCPGQARA